MVALKVHRNDSRLTDMFRWKITSEAFFGDFEPTNHERSALIFKAVHARVPTQQLRNPFLGILEP
jgi:hypothetical protein